MEGTKDILHGKWHEIKGQLRQHWGKLTDDDITQVNGKTEELAGALQKRYGYGKAEAESEINSWLTNRDKKESTQVDHHTQEEIDMKDNDQTVFDKAKVTYEDLKGKIEDKVEDYKSKKELRDQIGELKDEKKSIDKAETLQSKSDQAVENVKEMYIKRDVDNKIVELESKSEEAKVHSDELKRTADKYKEEIDHLKDKQKIDHKIDTLKVKSEHAAEKVREFESKKVLNEKIDTMKEDAAETKVVEDQRKTY